MSKSVDICNRQAKQWRKCRKVQILLLVQSKQWRKWRKVQISVTGRRNNGENGENSRFLQQKGTTKVDFLSATHISAYHFLTSIHDFCFSEFLGYELCFFITSSFSNLLVLILLFDWFSFQFFLFMSSTITFSVIVNCSVFRGFRLTLYISGISSFAGL